MSPQLTGLYPLSCSSQTISLLHLVELEWKEKDLKAKSGRTDHRFDRPFPFLLSLLAHLSPVSLSPPPTGHSPLDFTRLSTLPPLPLTSPLLSALGQLPISGPGRPPCWHWWPPGSAPRQQRQCRAQRHRGSSSAALHCACNATLLLLYLSPPCAPRCTSAGRCSAVQTVRGEWR